jgi:hypothetical protein
MNSRAVHNAVCVITLVFFFGLVAFFSTIGAIMQLLGISAQVFHTFVGATIFVIMLFAFMRTVQRDFCN